MNKRVWLVVLLVLVGVVLLRSENRERILGFKDSLFGGDEVVLVAVGDVMLSRSVNTTMIRRRDWRYPFLKTASVLASGDIMFGNLESPFGENCPYTDTGMVFCADKKSVQGLEYAGFDVMSLQNNHDLNQGKLGLEASEEWLESHAIAGVVEGEVEVIERNGVKFAFVAFDDVSARVDEDELVELVGRAVRISDVVVVSVHWGWEYRNSPNVRQKSLGRLMINAGADLVLGHHPHWVQTVEEYGDGLIVYSLGNFVFDQMWSQKTREGVVARIKFKDEELVDYELLPVVIYDYSQPRFEALRLPG